MGRLAFMPIAGMGPVQTASQKHIPFGVIGCFEE